MPLHACKLLDPDSVVGFLQASNDVMNPPEDAGQPEIPPADNAKMSAGTTCKWYPNDSSKRRLVAAFVVFTDDGAAKDAVASFVASMKIADPASGNAASVPHLADEAVQGTNWFAARKGSRYVTLVFTPPGGANNGGFSELMLDVTGRAFATF